MEAWVALLAVNELLRYRPVDDLYEEWLDRVAELVRAAGGSPRRPFRCAAPRPTRATKLRGRTSRLLSKKMLWLQGAWPLGGTRSVRCQRSKNGAAKKSLARKGLPGHSLLRHAATLLQLWHAKTPRYSQQQRMRTRKTKLSLTQSLPWPPQAAVPTPPSCVASRGPASSSQTCLLVMTARLTLPSSSSSMSWASKLLAGMKRSW